MRGIFLWLFDIMILKIRYLICYKNLNNWYKNKKKYFVFFIFFIFYRLVIFKNYLYRNRVNLVIYLVFRIFIRFWLIKMIRIILFFVFWFCFILFDNIFLLIVMFRIGFCIYVFLISVGNIFIKWNMYYWFVVFIVEDVCFKIWRGKMIVFD